ncbi:SET domain-containing protein [Peniophora sp. CONT]|nr:SET domain-containing protein [Peniophora sp. CONT]
MSDTLSRIYSEVRSEYVRGQGARDGSIARRAVRKPLERVNKTFESNLLDSWMTEGADDDENTSHVDIDNSGHHVVASLVSTTYDSGFASETCELTCNTMVTRLLPDAFQPHPRYEACAPSDHNLGYRAGDGNHPLATAAPFLPYADTADVPPVGVKSVPFCAKAFLKEYEDVVDWKELRNPDHEAIRYEFVRRACSQRDFPLNSVDKFLREHNQTSGRDTIIRFAQRDRPSWMDKYTQQDGKLLNEVLRVAEIPEEQIRNGAQSMCHLCKTFHCLRHTDKYYTCKEPGCGSYILCDKHRHKHVKETDFAAQNVAKLTADDIRVRSMDQPPSPFECGPTCFMVMTVEDQESARRQLQDHPWTKDECNEVLFALQSQGPDSSPCDIGRLIGQPCVEIWLLRAKFIEDGELSFDPHTSEERVLPITEHDELAWSDDSKGVRLNATPRPCHHAGPCRESEDCVCHRANFHCLPSCRCESDCDMRWKGCDCGQRGVSCRDSDLCPCTTGSRECEVDTCIGCGPSSNTCKNMVLQFNKRPRLEVKTGKHGLGTFAMEHIRKKQFIGEYITEVNIAEHDLVKSFHRNHVGLNYSYDTVFRPHEDEEKNKKKKKKKGGDPSDDEDPDESAFYTYDAARVGSVMRYMNDSHPRRRLINVEVKYLFSRGEIHIAMFAKDNIKVGKELFLEYGKAYWKKHPVGNNEDANAWEEDDGDE